MDFHLIQQNNFEKKKKKKKLGELIWVMRTSTAVVTFIKF